MRETISIQEALIYTMVIVSASDNAMADPEMQFIGKTVQYLPVFQGFDASSLIEVAQDCSKRLQPENGMNEVLDLIARTLPARLYDTAYALGVEVAASDLTLQKEEIRILQIFRDRFHLDKLTAAAIEHSAIARYRTA